MRRPKSGALFGRVRPSAGETAEVRPERDHEIHLIARSKNAPEIEVPWSIRLLAEWSWRALAIAALAVVIAVLVIQLQSIVVPALIAVIFTVALNPLARFFSERLRFPRVLAAIVTILLLIGFFALLVAFAGRSIAQGFNRLQDQTLQGFEELLDWLANGPFNISTAQLEIWIAEVQKVLQENYTTLISGALSATSSLVNLGFGLFLVLFLVLFFLMDGRGIWIWFVRLLPPTWRETTHEAAIRSYVSLSGYVKATVLVALIDAVGIAGGAFFLNVQLWLPIGVLVFIFSFIPIVGALLSGTIACLVALVDQGFGTAVILLIVVLVVQQIESNVLQPFIMGSNVSLHPVAVLLGVAAGTYVMGIVGAIFAVPLMAFANTFMLYLAGHDKFPHLATKRDRPGGPPGGLGDQIRASYGYAPRGDGMDEFLRSSTGELRIARDINHGPMEYPERVRPVERAQRVRPAEHVVPPKPKEYVDPATLVPPAEHVAPPKPKEYVDPATLVPLAEHVAPVRPAERAHPAAPAQPTPPSATDPE